MFVGLVLPVLIGVMAVDAVGKNVLVSLSSVIVIFLSAEGKIREKGIQLALVFLLLICIDNLYASIPQCFVFGEEYKMNMSYLCLLYTSGLNRYR